VKGCCAVVVFVLYKNQISISNIHQADPATLAMQLENSQLGLG
jgi:hypothetical protein